MNNPTLSQILGVIPTDVPADQKLEDLRGWDSLKHVRLILEIEQRLGRQLTDSEMEGLTTIGRLREILTDGA